MIILFQCLTLLLAFFLNKNSSLKWLIIFNIWWIIWIIASYYFPYGGYSISGETYLLIVIFITLVNIGYSLAGCGNTRPDNILFETMACSFDRLISKNRVVLVAISVSCLYLFQLFFRYRAIASADISSARTARYFVGLLFSSTLEILLYNYLIVAINYLSVFIVAFSLAFRRINRLVFVLATAEVLLFCSIGSSRMPLVQLGVELCILLIIQSTRMPRLNQKHPIRDLLLLLLFSAFAVCVMICFTSLRLGFSQPNLYSFTQSANTFFNQAVSYNTGPISGLSLQLDSGQLYDHHLVGRAVLLNGLDELASYGASILGQSFQAANQLIGESTYVTLSIGDNSFNALYTCIYWFYFDSGVAGVVIFSLLFGIVIKSAVSFFSRECTLGSLMLLVHVLYFFFVSNQSWGISSVASLVYLSLILIVFSPHKSKDNLSIQSESPNSTLREMNRHD